MGRLQIVLRQARAALANCLAMQAQEPCDEELEPLARSILDYAAMRLSEAPEQGSLFEPAELAFRFRETELTIEDALCLLESRGQATEVEGLWTFSLSALDLNKKVLGSVPARG